MYPHLKLKYVTIYEASLDVEDERTITHVRGQVTMITIL